MTSNFDLKGKAREIDISKYEDRLVNGHWFKRKICFFFGHDKVFPHPNKSLWFCVRCEMDRTFR